jgi:hypothetical protein
MAILHTVNKCAHMNNLEKFHIYEITKQGTRLNDTFADMTNPIFDILIQACRRKQVYVIKTGFMNSPLLFS